MTPDGWGSVLSTIGVFICGGLVHAIYLLSQMRSELKYLNKEAEESKTDRGRIWEHLTANEHAATQRGELLVRHDAVIEQLDKQTSDNTRRIEKWDSWTRQHFKEAFQS